MDCFIFHSHCYRNTGNYIFDDLVEGGPEHRHGIIPAPTHQGDAMATIGTAAPFWFTVAFVTVFTFIGAQVIPLFPAFILERFGYIMPAIFAGIYVQMAMKDIRTGIIIVFSGVVVNRVFYVYDRKKAA